MTGMTRDEKERRNSLVNGLRRSLGKGDGDDDSWLWWSWVKEWSDWNKISPNLQREIENCDGDIMNYFANELTELAKRTIPVIHEIEATGA